MSEQSTVTRRMYATSMLYDLNQIVSNLSQINSQMDSSLSIEDAYLNISLLDDSINHQYKSIFNEKMYQEEANNDTDINQLIDLFPLNHKGYSFKSEDAEKFKTGMRYLCSDKNISPRNLVYALRNGIDRIFSLLQIITTKKSKIQDYQYEEFWYEFFYHNNALYSRYAQVDYKKWREEHDWQDMQVLKDKLTQEILKLLKSGIFNYDITPVKRDIANSVITIPEDALEDGMDIPDNIQLECARFSKYVTFKEDILCLNYVKLGKYIYKHYDALKENMKDSLIYFDSILLLINDDMAKCNPKLKKYTKFYEDEKLEEVLNSGLEIIDSCKSLLKEGVSKDFLGNYLRAAFYGDTKLEVQAKLKGQSKIKLISTMLGMLKTTLKVFKKEVISADLAQALATVVKKPKEDSLKRYIDEGAGDTQSKLSRWTTQYVINELGNKSERLFLDISQK